jgi:hypothetical protein
MGIEGATWGLGTREGEGFSIYFIHILKRPFIGSRGGGSGTHAPAVPHTKAWRTKGGGALLWRGFTQITVPLSSPLSVRSDY